MFGKSRGNEVPFAGPLEPFAKEGKYFIPKEIVGHPDWVVKEARTKWGILETKGVHPLNDLERTKQDMELLQENFAEFIPDSGIVLGKNEKGKEVVYIVQRKIEGQSLNDVKFNEETAAQLRAFLDQVLVTYKKYLQKPEGQEEYSSIFPDVKGWNFLVGLDKQKDHEKSRLYFVDTYPVEGSSVNDFVGPCLRAVVKPTFKGQWWKIIDEFAVKARKELKEYMSHPGMEWTQR